MRAWPPVSHLSAFIQDMALPYVPPSRYNNDTLEDIEEVIPTKPPSEMSQRAENLKILLWQYENNRSITTGWHYAFLVSYILIGVTAIFANGLVVLAVVRNKKVMIMCCDKK
jgi:hypothetical protein